MEGTGQSHSPVGVMCWSALHAGDSEKSHLKKPASPSNTFQQGGTIWVISLQPNSQNWIHTNKPHRE